MKSLFLLSYKTVTCAALVISAAFFSPIAHGANITWGTPTQISSVNDVSTTGTLIGAFNVGDQGVPRTVVNGVNFQSFGTTNGNGSSGNFTSVGSGSISQTNTGHGSASAPFSNLSPEYRALLQSAAIPDNGPMMLAISGLILGMQYQFQWWANDSMNTNGRTTATAGNSVSLRNNATGPGDGGLGQWVIGTFTADAATQNITFRGDGDFASVNGFQLRQLAPAAPGVPDSGSTLALLGLAVSGIGFARRKLRR